MSTKVLVEESSLRSIGAAIRAKNNTATIYKPSEMATAISEISGFPEPTGSVSISQNGTVDVKNYASANVNVTLPSANGVSF